MAGKKLPSLFTVDLEWDNAMESDPSTVRDDEYQFAKPVRSGDYQAERMLALDVATVTGFCTRTASGTWNLTPKKDESKGMRLIRLRSKLKDITQLEDIKLIVFEDIPIYGKHPNTVGIEMIGVLKLFCEDSGIEYKSYPATVIKKFGGKGNANKEQMVEYAKRYKKDVTDHNEADAILLYHCAKEDLQI